MATGDLTPGQRLTDGLHLKDSEAGDFWKEPRLHIEYLAPDGETWKPLKLSEKTLAAYDYPDRDRGVAWSWMVRLPTGELRDITVRHVVEHEDGMITVNAFMDAATRAAWMQGEWHGYLLRGEWMEA